MDMSSVEQACTLQFGCNDLHRLFAHARRIRHEECINVDAFKCSGLLATAVRRRAIRRRAPILHWSVDRTTNRADKPS